VHRALKTSVLKRLCAVSVTVAVDAELDETSVDDVTQSEDVIVSQWEDVSQDMRNQLRAEFDEILYPLGYETSLIVIRRANSIALYFICMTLSAVMGLRGQWRIGKLRHIVESLFTFLSGATDRVRVKRLTWPLTGYERSLKFFSCVQGKQTISNKFVERYMYLKFWQMNLLYDFCF